MALLAEWLAGTTTAGRLLPVGKVDAYRVRHGLPPLERALVANGSPDSTQQMPSIINMAGAFVVSAAKHAAAGAPKASQEVIDARLSICKSCDKFNGSRCAICGCGCNGSKTFLNKLSWADQSCPHPDGPKWGKVDV